MFDGGGYGVTVTAAPVVAPPWQVSLPPPDLDERPVRLGRLMPAEHRSAAEKARELERITRVESRLAAYKAELVVSLARDRTEHLDLRPGTAGAASSAWARDPADEQLAGVSEFFPDELALILNCSRAAATTQAEHSHTLVEQLPSTWSALADGELDWPRARTFAEELGWTARDTEPAVVTEVESAVLPRAADLSVTKLRAEIRRELLRRDAAAGERRRARAERTADVTVRGAPDGMAELGCFLPAPLAAAIHQTVETAARAAKEAGDPQPIGQLRVAALADLVLRPWDTSRPPVTAHLTLVAPLPTLVRSPFPPPAGRGSPVEPGEVNGLPITADQLRELLVQLDALCPGGLQAPPGGSFDIALLDPATGALRATVSRPELARLARRGCPAHPTGGCGCPVLDRPPTVDRYRPTPAQRRFVRTRDRTCRHPGCTGRAAWTDLDHVLPHADGGPTDCRNLCCLCRRHHRLKTHAVGWRYAMTSHGVLSVATPSGVTRITRPPGWGPPSPPPPVEDPPPF